MAGIRNDFYEEVALRAEMSALTIRIENGVNRFNPVYSKLYELNEMRAQQYEKYANDLDEHPKFGEYLKLTFLATKEDWKLNTKLVKESRRLKKLGYKVKGMII